MNLTPIYAQKRLTLAERYGRQVFLLRTALVLALAVGAVSVQGQEICVATYADLDGDGRPSQEDTTLPGVTFRISGPAADSGYTTFEPFVGHSGERGEFRSELPHFEGPLNVDLVDWDERVVPDTRSISPQFEEQQQCYVAVFRFVLVQSPEPVVPPPPTDTDGDGRPDPSDNCPHTPNPD